MAKIQKLVKSVGEEFDEGVSLATTYLEDGAPYSAARVLRQTADKLEKMENDMRREMFAEGKIAAGL